MFENPLRKYQPGGEINNKEEITPEEANGFVDWLLNDKDSPYKGEKTKEALTAFIKDEKNLKQIHSWLNLYRSKGKKRKNEKTLFKDGGKMQQFICKHARGGVTGCGCNGMIVRAEEGTGLPEENPNYVLGTYKPSDYFDNPDDWTEVQTADGRVGYTRNYRNKTIFGKPGKNLTQVLVTRDKYGDIPRSTRRVYRNYFAPTMIEVQPEYHTWNGTNASPEFIQNMDSALEGTLPAREEDGGVIMGRAGLSRKQVREDKRKVKQLMGNHAGYTAEERYVDLINQTRNWDQYAGMTRLGRKNMINQQILGTNKPVEEEVVEIPTPKALIPEPLAETKPAVTIITPKDTGPINYDGMSFGNAFATARKAGANVFKWRGNLYTTELDPNWKTRWGVGNSNNSSQSEAKGSKSDVEGAGNNNSSTSGEIEPAVVVANRPQPKSYSISRENAQLIVTKFVKGNRSDREAIWNNLRKYYPGLGEYNHYDVNNNYVFADAIAQLVK